MTFFPQGSPRSVLRSTFQIDNAISDACDLYHFLHVMYAHKVRPVQNARRNRCGGSPDALFRWRWTKVAPRKPLREVPTSSG